MELVSRLAYSLTLRKRVASIDLNLDLDHDLNLSSHIFRSELGNTASELARINPINIETIWYS